MTQVNKRGRPPRLTQSLVNDLAAAIKSNAPINFACAYVGIPRETLHLWRNRATAAESKKPSERNSHERMCMQLFHALAQAESEGFMIGWAQIYEASRPTVLRRTTTTTVQTPIAILTARGVKVEGKPDELITTTTTLVEEKQVAGDWRALAHLMARRYRSEMAERLVEGTDEQPDSTGPTLDESIAELERIREERQQLRLVQGGQASETG